MLEMPETQTEHSRHETLHGRMCTLSGTRVFGVGCRPLPFAGEAEASGTGRGDLIVDVAARTRLEWMYDVK